jgi:hypothetical protein
MGDLAQVKTMVRWSNGMVSAFDANGEQIPELQGIFAEKKASLQNVSASEYRMGSWLDGTRAVSREEFYA